MQRRVRESIVVDPGVDDYYIGLGACLAGGLPQEAAQLSLKSRMGKRRDAAHVAAHGMVAGKPVVDVDARPLHVHGKLAVTLAPDEERHVRLAELGNLQLDREAVGVGSRRPSHVVLGHRSVVPCAAEYHHHAMHSLRHGRIAQNEDSLVREACAQTLRRVEGEYFADACVREERGCSIIAAWRQSRRETRDRDQQPDETM